jgi:hypothetical protein
LTILATTLNQETIKKAEVPRPMIVEDKIVGTYNIKLMCNN